MLAHRIETTINQDQTILLENLPFHSGENVEVIILARPLQETKQDRYPLRGTVVEYIDPTEPVAQNDWEFEQ
jgi:hypothetical protein